ncbi:hypothetical protein BRADI_1g20395v3 [Brachypodium distachyon]|uniref:Knottin scorpion toxin-like domain-containing protein n=1 Tax=Brachypodium distachyon TaxID=15368 RepID=A0A0Q3GVS6_BRADI|nr:hypothetical protein BRADI_1g20395v3 [Brachypodium distachyon]
MARKITMVVVASILILVSLVSCDVVRGGCQDQSTNKYCNSPGDCAWLCHEAGHKAGQCEPQPDGSYGNCICVVCTDDRSPAPQPGKPAESQPLPKEQNFGSNA